MLSLRQHSYMKVNPFFQNGQNHHALNIKYLHRMNGLYLYENINLITGLNKWYICTSLQIKSNLYTHTDKQTHSHKRTYICMYTLCVFSMIYFVIEVAHHTQRSSKEYLNLISLSLTSTNSTKQFKLFS